MITRINEFRKILEKTKKNDGVDLVIVDVQEQYKQYFTERYLVELKEYCKDYTRVFQIWDNNKAEKPDYIFPNQVGTYEKTYGIQLDINTGENFFTPETWPAIKAKIEAVPDDGDSFETINGECWVYVGQPHLWFLCTKPLVKLFKDFVRQERKIVLIGGAANECLRDLIISMKAFGVNVSYDLDFVYSKEGSKFSNKYQPTEEDLQAIKDKEDKHLKKKEKKST